MASDFGAPGDGQKTPGPGDGREPPEDAKGAKDPAKPGEGT